MTYRIKSSDCTWIASPDCNRAGDDERRLIDARDRVVVIGEVNDAEANYSFDDFALVWLDGLFYLLNTSGCSCPSPSEEWNVTFGPVDLAAMRQHLEDAGGEHGYGVTQRQHSEFMALCDQADAFLQSGCIVPAPCGHDDCSRHPELAEACRAAAEKGGE